MSITTCVRSLIEQRLVKPSSQAAVRMLHWLVARWDVVLSTVTLGAAAGYLAFLMLFTQELFWDFKSYVAAVRAMELGVSPYDRAWITSQFGEGILQFVYPPLIAEAFYKLSSFVLTPVGLTALLVASIVSMLAIPYLLTDCPRRWYSPRFLYVCGFFFVLYGFGGMRLVASGNIQPLVCAAIIGSTVVAVRTKGYTLFWITVVFASLIKIYFLVFLLFPLILDKRYVAGISFVLVTTVLYVANYLFSPELFSEYIELMGRLSRDTMIVGFSPYALTITGFQTLFPNDYRLSAGALVMHFILVIIIVALAWAVAARHDRPHRFDLFCCWLFMSAYLASPRLLEYDMAILVVPLVLLGRMLLLSGGIGAAAAAAVGLCGVILIRTPFSPWVGTFVFFGVWFGAAVHWLQTPTAAQHDNEQSLPCGTR